MPEVKGVVGLWVKLISIYGQIILDHNIYERQRRDHDN